MAARGYRPPRFRPRTPYRLKRWLNAHVRPHGSPRQRLVRQRHRLIPVWGFELKALAWLLRNGERR